MREREPRYAVSLPAKMRIDNRWSDAAIQNVSAHGLMMKAARPPKLGAYVEIRRATNLIIARVVWVKNALFGLRTQDRLDLRSLLYAAARPAGSAELPIVDRRHSWRMEPGRTHEQARVLGERLQFVVALIAIVVLTFFAAQEVWHVLGAPLAAVQAALPS